MNRPHTTHAQHALRCVLRLPAERRLERLRSILWRVGALCPDTPTQGGGSVAGSDQFAIIALPDGSALLLYDMGGLGRPWATAHASAEEAWHDVVWWWRHPAFWPERASAEGL